MASVYACHRVRFVNRPLAGATFVPRIILDRSRASRLYTPAMRILNIVSGIAVLFIALAFEHLLYHTFTLESPDSTIHKAVMVCVGAIGVLSFVGGCLLISRKN
jgi:nitrate reductase gamma subunit